MAPYFDEAVSTFSKYALNLLGHGIGLSSSTSGSEYSSFGGYRRSLESYQSMIRQFPLQITRSNASSSNFLIVSLLDDTHYLSIDVDGYIYFHRDTITSFMCLLTFVSFWIKNIPDFLGSICFTDRRNLNLSSKHIDLMSVVRKIGYKKEP